MFKNTGPPTMRNGKTKQPKPTLAERTRPPDAPDPQRQPPHHSEPRGTYQHGAIPAALTQCPPQARSCEAPMPLVTAWRHFFQAFRLKNPADSILRRDEHGPATKKQKCWALESGMMLWSGTRTSARCHVPRTCASLSSESAGKLEGDAEQPCPCTDLCRRPTLFLQPDVFSEGDNWKRLEENSSLHKNYMPLFEGSVWGEL